MTLDSAASVLASAVTNLTATATTNLSLILNEFNMVGNEYTIVMGGGSSGVSVATSTIGDNVDGSIAPTLPEMFSNYSESGNYTMCPKLNMEMSKIFFMMLYAVVCIVGILGNTLVIYVVLRFSNMQTVTNMYILNLAIADDCFLIGIPFLITTMHLGHWTFGRMMCKAFMVSTSITQFTSSIFLLIMSTDRYIAICRHVSAGKYRTSFVSRVVSGIAWITSALFMLPIMLYSDTVETGNGSTCIIIWPENVGHLPGLSFTLYSLILGFIIPLCFIMTFYCLVIRKLRSVGRKTNKSKSKRRSHRKATKLVLTVITVYILCWLPYWITQVALITSNPEQCSTRLKITVFLLAGCLGYCNSAINPILYAYLSDNFKKCFLKACQCAGTKEVNAQLKLENSVLPKKSKNRNPKFIETNQLISTTKSTIEQNSKMLSEPVTTTTGTSAVSSRNPSPPNQRNNHLTVINNNQTNNNHHHHHNHHIQIPNTNNHQIENNELIQLS